MTAVLENMELSMFVWSDRPAGTALLVDPFVVLSNVAPELNVSAKIPMKGRTDSYKCILVSFLDIYASAAQFSIVQHLKMSLQFRFSEQLDLSSGSSLRPS